jgi:hypothetical protein
LADYRRDGDDLRQAGVELKLVDESTPIIDAGKIYAMEQH